MKSYENVNEQIMKLLLNNDLLKTDEDYNDTSTIYHYTSSNGLLGIIKPHKNPSIYFTQYDCLNDKSEREEFFDFFKNYCDFKLKQSLISKDFYNKVNNILENRNAFDYDFVTYINKDEKNCTHLTTAECDTYLCCFSTDNDLLSMWNYYTKSQHYEGYSIGIDSSIFHSTNSYNKGFCISLKKVLYNNNDKVNKLDSTVFELSKYFDDANQNSKRTIESIVGRIIKDFQFSFKNIAFEHEHEARAILKIPKDKSVFKGNTGFKNFDVKYRNSNGYIVPYIEYELPKDSIWEITTAPLLEKDIGTKSIVKMLESYGYDYVKVKASEIPIRF